jgi:soluble lytic murein transglycosylase-like protein
MTSGLLAAALAGLILVAAGALGHLAVPAAGAAVAVVPAVQPPRLDASLPTPTESRWAARPDATASTTSVFLRPAPRAPQPAAVPARGAAPLPAAVPPPPAVAPEDARPARLNGAVPAAIRRWEPLILRYSAQHDLDPHLLAALMQVESAGREDAVSPKNAIGLMQVLDGPTDPEQNVARGAEILAGHLRAFGGDLDLALAAYNAGPGAVRAHGGVPPYEETRWHGYLTRWWYWAYTQA